MARNSLHAALRCCLLLLLLVSLFPPVSGTQEWPFNLSREDRGRLFDQVWRAINDNYYDRNFNGVDWRIQRDIYRPQAEAATTSDDLYRVLRQMIGRLGDAHTRIYSPEDRFDRFRPTGTSVGVIVRRIEGKPVVVSVEPGSEAYRLGVRPGFTVSRIDGTPIDTKLERIRADVGESSTQTALELQSYDRIFSGQHDTTVSVTFIDLEGKYLPVTLMRKYVEYQRRVIVRELPYKIGYIELTGFGPEIEKEFDYAMEYVQGTRGLILDLRNNGGGFVTTVGQVASYFFDEETDLGEFITRQGRSTRRRTQRLRTLYREPLVVLVSSRSASGSEIFAAAMQERKRAMIFGTSQTTCGCLLGVSRTLKLLDGGKLNISDTDYRTALGRRIEGIGVKPDMLVDVLAADLFSGRDRPLETAVDQLGRTIAFGQSSGSMDFKLKIPLLNTGPMSRESPSTQFKH
jgi:carboxyl-terminal processing protease